MVGKNERHVFLSPFSATAYKYGSENAKQLSAGLGVTLAVPSSSSGWFSPATGSSAGQIPADQQLRNLLR